MLVKVLFIVGLYARQGSARPLGMSNVSDLLAIAERFFEQKVSELLHEKRMKAEGNGTQLNARKAKRDARTAAGREKLDNLAKKLVELAYIQEAMLKEQCADPAALYHEIKASMTPGFADQNPIAVSPPMPAMPPQFIMPPPHMPPPFHIFAPGQLPPQMLPPPPPPPTIVAPKRVITPFGPMSKPLNPNADPWEMKPPSPKQSSLPPSVKVPSRLAIAYTNFDGSSTARSVNTDTDAEESVEFVVDATTPMFGATSEVLRSLGPEFDAIRDQKDNEEISPTSIFEQAYPKLERSKHPFQ